MPKPILVVYYLPEVVQPNGDVDSVKMNETIAERFPDYHTIALPSRLSIEGDCEDIRFLVLNADKMEPIEFQDFKNQILEAIKIK